MDFASNNVTDDSRESKIVQSSMLREKQNAYIHLTYVRKEFTMCLKAIEEQLKLTNGQAEYPLYVKGKCISAYLIIQYSYPHFSSNFEKTRKN